MCTVTYIPSRHGCFITSSRDESVLRPTAIMPGRYEHKGVVLVYPKDTRANGSWIAFTQTGNAAVLLNGAFVKHVSKPPYRKSRGLIFLDIISHPQPVAGFSEIDLDNIEPFTLVMYTGGMLSEARWDGEQKHCTALDETTPHIWSSATLYAPAVINTRKQWFENWLKETTAPAATSIFDFHRFAGDGDSQNSVLMNRNNEMCTVSITGIDMSFDAATMQYFDIKENRHSLKTLQLHTTTV